MAKYRLVQVIDRSRRGFVTEKYCIQRRILLFWWFTINNTITSSLPDAQYELSVREQKVLGKEIRVLHHDTVFIPETKSQEQPRLENEYPDREDGILH